MIETNASMISLFCSLGVAALLELLKSTIDAMLGCVTVPLQCASPQAISKTRHDKARPTLVCAAFVSFELILMYTISV
jgi:hypothetical protein